MYNEKTDESMHGRAVSPKESEAVLINNLIELGRTNGKLTIQEIIDAFEDFAFDPSLVDRVWEALVAANIEIDEYIDCVPLDELEEFFEQTEEQES